MHVCVAAGHMCWAIQNNAKTDRNIFFGSKNLRALADNLDQEDVGGWIWLLLIRRCLPSFFCMPDVGCEG